MSLRPETEVRLNTFKPRDYQIPLLDAIENKGYKKVICVMPRRAGKDIVCFNIMIRQALMRIGNYAYLLPNAVQARRVMFDGITNDGKRILDFIPEELIKSINIAQMKIVLVNGSTIQFIGSENYDSLRGTNYVGVVISEAAYSHPHVYPTIKPILAANSGWVILISTPHSTNHFYTLFEVARHNPNEWFTYFQTIEETRHLSWEEVEEEIARGEISLDMALQEYKCDFKTGTIGAYYATYLTNMELNHQIGPINWEPSFPVHTAWDIGVRDSTSILMFQSISRQIHIIDMYQNSNVGLDHYINVLQSKPYTWGKHIGPHDIEVREFTGGGLTRKEKAAELGFNFMIAPRLSIADGIESVRTVLPRTYINRDNCKILIECLRNYRKEYDVAKKIYKDKPYHDHHSHVADALRYLCVSLPKIQTNSDPEALNKRYYETVYGGNDFGGPFSNNNYYR